MAESRGTLITIEGIDGSGKDTIAEAIVAQLKNQGKSVFDLDAWSRREGKLPLPEDAGDTDVIFFSEPSYVWVGAAIRNELIRTGTDYDVSTIAEGFALDRLTLFRRCILPWRARGKTIIQQRHVSTSLVYQGMQLGEEVVAALPGNALELDAAPDAIIIASCEPKTALERTTKRTDKQDDAVFEKLELLEKFHKRYHSDWFKNLWQERGTELHYLDANQPIESVKTAATDIIKLLLS
jgi:dTMP kinase